MAECYMRYGKMEMVKEQFTAALEYYFKAIKIREELGDKDLSYAYYFAAHAYSDTFNPDLAITYFKKALSLYVQVDDKTMIALCYNNIGANYYDNDKRLSLQYHMESLKISEEISSKRAMSYSYYWVGTLYIDNADFALARQYLDKAEKLCLEISNNHILAYTHISFGKLSTIGKDYPVATVHFEKAWEIVMRVGNKTWERAVYRDWYLLKKAIGDFEGALDLYEKYIRLDREVNRNELNEKVAAVKFKADIEKNEKDLEIQHLRNVELKQEKDLAEQQRLRAEDSEKFKQQFLANMSHEIRTPMNAVMGMVNLLLDTPLNEKQQKYLAAVKRSSQNLLVILNDILDLSKLEAGKMELEKIPFDLRVQIEHVMDIMHLRAEEKGLLFTAEIAETVPRVVIGDAPRLNQILINILSNAIKFTEKGSVKLLVSANGLGETKFTITDTGIGMDAAQQKKIFESFSQAENSTSRKYGGTGLGLAISKTLVELHKGMIDVKSYRGLGSEFVFTIPYAAGKEEDILTAGSMAGPDYSALAKLRILVAEDYEFNQIVIKDTLEHLIPGIEVEIAANGKIVIEKLEKGRYDLVLMDIQMPEMDGYEATRFIRNNLKMDIPVIALTASVIRSDLDKCTDAGMNGYVPKPFERGDLLRELMKYQTQSI